MLCLPCSSLAGLSPGVHCPDVSHLMESSSLMDQAAVPSPTLWLSTGLSPVSPASLCAGKTSTGHNTPGVAFHMGNQTVMIFLFFTCLEMISRINCSHSRDGGEPDHPVVPQILLLALLKDRSDICFPAGFGYFSTLSNETLTSRPVKRPKSLTLLSRSPGLCSCFSPSFPSGF